MSDAVALHEPERERQAPEPAPAAPPADRPSSPLLSGEAVQAELLRAQAMANSAPESDSANATEDAGDSAAAAADSASEASSRRRSTRRAAGSEAPPDSEEAASARRRIRKSSESPEAPEAAAQTAEADAPVVRRRGRPPKNAAPAAFPGASAEPAGSGDAEPSAQLAADAPEAASLAQVLEREPAAEASQASGAGSAEAAERQGSSAQGSSDHVGQSSGDEGRERAPFEPRAENRPAEGVPGAPGAPGERAFEPRGFEGRGHENRGNEIRTNESRGLDARGMRLRSRPEGRPDGRPEPREEGRRGEGFGGNGFVPRAGFGAGSTGWREEVGPNGIRLTNREIERREVEARAGEARPPEARPTEARPTEARPEIRPEARPIEARLLEGRALEPRGFEAREEGRARPDSRGDNSRDNRFGRDRNGRDGNRGQQDGRSQQDVRNQQDPRERGLDRFEREALRAKPELDTPALEALALEDLRRAVLEMGEANAPALGRDELIQRALELQALAQGVAFKRGLLEILSDGRGFLRTEGYLSSDGDVYVSSSQIKRFGLKTGDIVSGQVRPPKGDERHSGLLRLEAVNGLAPELLKARKEFEKLTPVFPDERWRLETAQENVTARVIDLVSPIGKGQRGLIVAPPKAGKTTLIKSIANSISRNHPEAELIVLLIDERPEEVTDISRSVRGEVVASTFDETAENHMRVAELVFEKAKRMVEQKKDVVVLLDSLTRLSRASNLVVTSSGRTMSGGLDPAAMHKPKKMFGAARNIEEGGSLTILATVLVDTGSRMDEYIFEEFKGTGNMDLVLDRNLFDQRIFPAIDINKSGTRRDDLLMSKEELASTFHLRRTLAQLDNEKSVTLLIDRLRKTTTNADFMQIVSRSAKQSPAQTP